MKKIASSLAILLVIALFSSCSTDRDDELGPVSALEIKNFIYDGMQLYYLYKPDVEVLANDFFDSRDARNEFLNTFDTPENLFYDGLLSTVDRFSFMTDDYRELERSFAGISKTSGIDYGLSLDRNDPNFAFAWVRYVMPDTPAEDAGVDRGMIFNSINGERLTTIANANGTYSLSQRSRELLDLDDFTIELVEFDSNEELQPTGTTFSLTQVEYTENPVFIAKTLTIDNRKIGYLMYNAYRRNFDVQLNNAFAQFKADGVQDLVLDLRYNGCGSVETAIDLTSMITGQFNGEIITKQRWNPEIQAYLESQNAESLIDRFDNTISNGNATNSLNLTRLFVIGTSSTASASELTIIGLDPYIDVKTIGTTTTGKFQASITLYDSDSFGRNDDSLNPNHFYAIQPLVYTYENANAVVGPPSGITPDFELRESLSNLGTLGNPDEPLLSLALDQILGRSHATKSFTGIKFEVNTTIENLGLDFQRMYIDDLPESLQNLR